MPWPLGGNWWKSYRLQRPQVLVADPQRTEKPSKGARPEVFQATEMDDAFISFTSSLPSH